MNPAIAVSKSYTKPIIERVVHEWKIKDFRYALVGTRPLKSTAFSTPNGVTFDLRICYHLDDLNIGLYPFFMNCKGVDATIRTSILDANGIKKCCRIAELQYISCKNGYVMALYVSKKMSFNKTNGLLPNDTLTILCDIVIRVDTINAACDFVTPEYRLLDHLEPILESERFCDVTFDVCGRNIRAHKLILVAGSPVFEAMFKHEMTEQVKHHVCITDVTPEVFEAMLKFMYTGKPKNLDKMAEDLLVAANKYALDALKVKCEEALSVSLKIENAADVLILADVHNAQQLKYEAINYINKNADLVKKAVGYKSMTTSHPHLMAELKECHCRMIANLRL